MSVSFNGIGQVCATFLGSGMVEGDVVKMGSRATVQKCGAGDTFCGVALCCKEDACSVQVKGFVSVAYSGTVPAVGVALLAADGSGGVKTVETGGQSVLVVDADTAAKTVTILL